MAAVLAVAACGGKSTLGEPTDTSAPTCDEPDADFLESYEQCTAATDDAECVAAGGTWGRVGSLPREYCQCETGQGDCPCTLSSQCLSGYCLGEHGPGVYECSAQGTCSEGSIARGCYCFFDERTGTASYARND